MEKQPGLLFLALLFFCPLHSSYSVIPRFC